MTKNVILKMDIEMCSFIKYRATQLWLLYLLSLFDSGPAGGSLFSRSSFDTYI